MIRVDIQKFSFLQRLKLAWCALFSERLRFENTNERPEIDRLMNLVEFGWTVIANAGTALGDWNTLPEVWRKAAVLYREQYHAALDRRHFRPEVKL